MKTTLQRTTTSNGNHQPARVSRPTQASAGRVKIATARAIGFRVARAGGADASFTAETSMKDLLGGEGERKWTLVAGRHRVNAGATGAAKTAGQRGAGRPVPGA